MPEANQGTIEAIILKKNVFSESNEIVTLYSRELGKVRGVARAVKRLQSKLAFGLQQLFHSRIETVNARKHLTIIGAKPLNTFKNLREQPQAVHAALYGAELVMKSTADEQPNPELFDYFLKFLKHLDRDAAAEHRCFIFFGWQVLALTGYKTDPASCVLCGRPLAADQVFFSNRKGGFICKNCAARVADPARIAPDAYGILSEALRKPDDFELQEALLRTGSEAAAELRKISRAFVEYILEREIKSARYLYK